MANIKPFLNKIRTAIFGKEVRGSLADGLEAVNKETENATKLSKDTSDKQNILNKKYDDQIANITNENPSISELVDFRTSGTTGQSYPTAGKRADAIDAQLAKTADKAFYNNIMQHKLPHIMVTILDDDARLELYDTLYPTLKNLGVKFTSAVVTERVGNTVFTISLEKYKEMLNSGYVEFVSHGANHVHLAELPEDELDYELRASKEWLIKNGGNPDYLVYPFNSKNDLVLKKTREYYKGAFTTTGNITKPPLSSFLIERVNMDNPLSYIKGKVDELNGEGGWLILNSHAHYDSVTEEFVTDIVNYVRSKDIEFVTVGEGMKHFGNLIDTEKGVVGVDGTVTGIFSTFKYLDVNPIEIDNNTHLREFENNCLTTMNFTNVVASEKGFPTGGTYDVDRRSYSSFSRSFLYPHQNNSFYYVRFWDTVDDSWSEWDVIYLENLTVNEVTSQTKPGEMKRKYFTTEITEHNVEGFPNERRGLLTTDIRGGNGLEFQEFQQSGGPLVHRRAFVRSTNQWSAWREGFSTQG